MKKLIIPAVLAVCAFMIFTASRKTPTQPELPQMQSFSATPRFPDKVECFGKEIDLTRWDMHERYERELTNMCYSHNNTLLTIKRANRWFPVLAPLLQKEGVPSDLIYLICIESSLNPRAYSAAKAAGLCQFIASTGKHYGLQIDDEVDERYHTEKAVHAMCTYMKEAYAKYGDWLTACASYNAGQGGISKRLEKTGAKAGFDLLLPEETSRYMFRIMAMKEILRDPYHYGFVLYSDQLYRPIRTREVKVSGTVTDWASWAKDHGTDYFQLKEFNPWLRDYGLKNKARKTYTVLIPVEEDMYYNGRRFDIYNDAWVVDR